MMRAAIVAIAIANGVVFWLLASMAVDGSGSGEFYYSLLKAGFLWIGGCMVVALVLHWRQWNGAAVILSLVALPAGFQVLVWTDRHQREVRKLSPDRPEYLAACQGAGPQYFDAPRAPITSVAYDWLPPALAPDITDVDVDERGNIKGSGFHLNGIQQTPGIEFVERRCCQFGGAPGERNGMAYVRHEGNTIPPRYVPELGADALVFYEATSRQLASKEYPLITVDVTVTDRRDGLKLATLRYAVDKQHKRACGETSPGHINVDDFIRRAISRDR